MSDAEAKKPGPSGGEKEVEARPFSANAEHGQVGASPSEPAEAKVIEHEYIARMGGSCDRTVNGKACGGHASEHRASAGEVKQPERIVAAAIQQDGVVYTGPHHHQIIRYMVALPLGIKTVKGVQGFITSANRFVGREEAVGVAAKAGQIEHLSELPHGLFSEQLWEVTDYQLAGKLIESSEPAQIEGSAARLAREIHRDYGVPGTCSTKVQCRKCLQIQDEIQAYGDARDRAAREEERLRIGKILRCSRLMASEMADYIERGE